MLLRWMVATIGLLSCWVGTVSPATAQQWYACRRLHTNECLVQIPPCGDAYIQLTSRTYDTQADACIAASSATDENGDQYCLNFTVGCPARGRTYKKSNHKR